MSHGGGVPGRLWRLVSIGGGFWAERRSSAEALRILSNLLQMRVINNCTLLKCQTIKEILFPSSELKALALNYLLTSGI